MAEYAIHYKCDTHHVAAVFQNGQEEEQDRHLWNKSENSSDAAYNSVHNEAGHQYRCTGRFKQPSGPSLDSGNKSVIGPVSHKSSQCCYGNIVNTPHNKDKNRDSQNPVCDNAVNPV
jgi:hypothetical protein